MGDRKALVDLAVETAEVDRDHARARADASAERAEEAIGARDEALQAQREAEHALADVERELKGYKGYMKGVAKTQKAQTLAAEEAVATATALLSNARRREEWLRIYTAVAAGYAATLGPGGVPLGGPHKVGKAAAEDLLGPLPEPEP